jgi:hypothetical protein
VPPGDTRRRGGDNDGYLASASTAQNTLLPSAPSPSRLTETVTFATPAGLTDETQTRAVELVTKEVPPGGPMPFGGTLPSPWESTRGRAVKGQYPLGVVRARRPFRAPRVPLMPHPCPIEGHEMDINGHER